MKYSKTICTVFCLLLILIFTITVEKGFNASGEEVATSDLGENGSGSGGESSGSGEETEAKILNMYYDPWDDSVVVETNIQTTVWCAEVKKEAGASLKGDAFLKYDSSYNEWYGRNIANIPLNEKTTEKGSKKLKISSDKTAYLYIMVGIPEKEKTAYKPNMIIEPCLYKKIDVNIDYSAILRDEEECAISSVKYKKKDNTSGTYSTKNTDEFYDFLSKLQYGYCTIEGKEKYYDYESTVVCPDEDDYTTLLCTDKPEGINISFRGKKITDGKFVYQKEEDEAYDWYYQYDSSWGDLRLYNLVLEYDEKYNISIYRDYLDYCEKNSETGKNISYYLENETRGKDGKRYFIVPIIFGPDDNIEDLINKDIVFTYGDRYVETYVNSQNSLTKKRNFFMETTENNVTKYRAITDFGIIVYNYDDNSEDNPGGYEETEGNVHQITVRLEKMSTASDFGIDVYSSSEKVKSKEGDSFTISRIKGINFSASAVNGHVDEEFWRDSKDKTKVKFIFRVLGSEAKDGKNAYRTGALTSVNVPKPQKLVSAKVDIKNDKLVVKNGFDYYIAGYTRVIEENGRETRKRTGPEWMTILPYNKEGKAEEAVIDAVDYHPVNKLSEDPKMFTPQKVTGILIDDILKYTNEIRIRKSVTVSKPVNLTDEYEEYTIYIEEDRTDAPIMTAKDNVYATLGDKDTLIMPEIKLAADDDNKAAFEFAVISKNDFEAELAETGTIDFTSIKWAKYKSGKKLTLGKTKTKYKLKTDEKATDHLLTKDSYILVRRCGYTYTDEDRYTRYVLASYYTVTKLSEITTDSGTSIVWIPTDIKANNYSTEKALQMVESAGYKKEWTYNGHHYLIVNKDNLSWSTANQICAAIGGHLVTITSAEEQASVEENNSKDLDLWIGGYEESTNVWAWVTGEKWDYTNWGEGEPNNMDNEHYAAVWPKQWNDMANGNKGEQCGFICEWDDDISYEKYTHN